MLWVVVIILSLLLLGVLVLVWLRKVQFDAVHRNFLDLVDHYGGKVVRSGFAVRPRFSGEMHGLPVSVSLYSEKQEKDKPRQFYISVYLKAEAKANFTILAQDWIKERSGEKRKQGARKPILNKSFMIETANKKMLKSLNIADLERVVKNISPLAYVLVSKKGLIAERISTNLIKDTEFEKIQPLLEGLYELSQLEPLPGKAENMPPA